MTLASLSFCHIASSCRQTALTLEPNIETRPSDSRSLLKTSDAGNKLCISKLCLQVGQCRPCWSLIQPSIQSRQNKCPQCVTMQTFDSNLSKHMGHSTSSLSNFCSSFNISSKYLTRLSKWRSFFSAASLPSLKRFNLSALFFLSSSSRAVGNPARASISSLCISCADFSMAVRCRCRTVSFSNLVDATAASALASVPLGEKMLQISSIRLWSGLS
mmetsp:Transcript_26536/g.42532  ORF Transcript_26536/g.42532 Transcript_26536/m.42532 type:complete len:216 (+) Transcript_26536:634-1281(+)